MYLNVVVTILTGLVLFELVCHLIYPLLFSSKPGKHFARYTGKSPEYFDQISQLHAAFEKGNFEEALKICQEMLKERPFEGTTLSYKAYSLYHLKQCAEAKAIFELLETLPDGKDCSKMIEKCSR